MKRTKVKKMKKIKNMKKRITITVPTRRGSELHRA